MNSLFKLNSNEKSSIYDKHYKFNKNCNQTQLGKMLLKCNNGNLSAVNINLVNPNFTQTFNQPIASITIDTACLCNLKLLLDFSGTITTITNSFMTLTNTFTLFKTCKTSIIRQPIATYNFNIINTSSPLPDSQTIKFQYSPCDDQCEDCCTYTLELTRVSSIFSGSSGSIFINGKLCAMAIDLSN